MSAPASAQLAALRQILAAQAVARKAERDKDDARVKATEKLRDEDLKDRQNAARTAEKERERRNKEAGKPPAPVSNTFGVETVRSADPSGSFLQTSPNFASFAPSPGGASAAVQTGNSQLLRGPTAPAQPGGAPGPQVAQAGGFRAPPTITQTERTQIPVSFGTGTALIPRTTITSTENVLTANKAAELNQGLIDDDLEARAAGLGALLFDMNMNNVDREEGMRIFQSEIADAERTYGPGFARMLTQRSLAGMRDAQATFNSQSRLREISGRPETIKLLKRLDQLKQSGATPETNAEMRTLNARLGKLIAPSGLRVTMNPDGTVTWEQGQLPSTNLVAKQQDILGNIDLARAELQALTTAIRDNPSLAGFAGRVRRGLVKAEGVLIGLDSLTGGVVRKSMGKIYSQLDQDIIKGRLDLTQLDEINPETGEPFVDPVDKEAFLKALRTDGREVLELKALEILLAYSLVRVNRPQRPNLLDLTINRQLASISESADPDAIVAKLELVDRFLEGKRQVALSNIGSTGLPAEPTVPRDFFTKPDREPEAPPKPAFRLNPETGKLEVVE